MPETSVQPTTDSSFEALSAPIQTPAPVRRTESIVTPELAARELYGTDAVPVRSRTREILKYLLSILILIGGVGVMFGLYLLKEPPKEQSPDQLTPLVDTTRAAPYAGLLDKVISGTVVPYREIRVAAEVSGNVIKKYDEFEAGNFVKKGTKLLEIDPTDYQLQLESGLAEVEQAQKMMEETQEEIAGAKRNIAIAETEYKLAQEEFDRNTRISTALSSTELDQAKRNLLTVESALVTRKNNLGMLDAKLHRMQASLALSNAQLNRTKLNLSKTTIVAPDDGVIVREVVQEGDYVRAGDQLVMFEDTSRSEVICNLTPTDLAWIRDNAPSSSEFGDEISDQDSFSVYHIPKTRVSVSEVAEPNIIWEGVLERFDGIGRDESTRTIPCRITIEKPIVQTEAGQRALVRGMYVKCRIEVQTSADESQRDFLAFPAVALQPGNFVWVVEEHKLKKVPVEVIDYTDQRIDTKITKIVIVATRQGTLQPGDEVVTTPIPQPSVGAQVMLEREQDITETGSLPAVE